MKRTACLLRGIPLVSSVLLPACGGKVVAENSGDLGFGGDTSVTVVVRTSTEEPTPVIVYSQLSVIPGTCREERDAVARGKIGGLLVRSPVPLESSFTVGGLQTARYAFVATTRRQDCAVTGFGCTDVDTSKFRAAIVEISPAAEPLQGSCLVSKGWECVAGTCRAPLE